MAITDLARELRQELPQKLNARRRALFGVELHSDGVLETHRRGKAIRLVSGPSDHAAGVPGPANEAVGVVRHLQRGASKQPVVLSALQGVPTHLRHPPRPELGDRSGQKTEALSRALLTRLEEELHPQANADARKPLL